jgi:hypothetical protein
LPREGNDMVYVGSVGTGFKERDAHSGSVKRKAPPVTYQGNGRLSLPNRISRVDR